MQRPRGVWLLALALLALASAGCGPSDPLDRKVEARTWLGFQQWQNQALADLPPRERKEFSAAVQQVRLLVMMQAAGQSPDELTRRQLALISGHTVREVIVTGLLAERARFADQIRANSQLLDFQLEQLRWRGTTDDDAELLEERANTLRERQTTAQDEIASIDARLLELTGQTAAELTRPEPAPSAPF